MSFLDDIGDAVKDVASTVTDGASHIAKEAFSTVLSPAENIAMKGLGAAASTVSDVFGGMDIFDSALDGAMTIGKTAFTVASPVLMLEAKLLSGVAEKAIGKNPLLGGILEGPGNDPSDLLKQVGMAKMSQRERIMFGAAMPEEEEMPPSPAPKSELAQVFSRNRGQEVSLNPQPLPPIADIRRNRGEEVSLNPQPLPPIADIRNRGQEVSLNPQPLPPIADILRNRGGEVSLNPQPLPPIADMLRNRGDEVSLNPQPLPPIADIRGNRGGEVSLNPQPLPPIADILRNRGDEVSLNPQPLPPIADILRNRGDEVSLNPQPLPPERINQEDLIKAQPNFLSKLSLNKGLRLNRAAARFV